MRKKLVSTDNAPKPKGPYSQAIAYGDFLFVSGQAPIDPKTQEVSGETIEEQATVVLTNLKAIIEEAGFSMKNTLKVTVFLANMSDFKRFNEVYKRFFPMDPPARTCIQAGLPLNNMKCEVDMILGK